MARKTIVTLVDDLDGSKASETVQFALDGVAYQIDLSSLNASKLRDELAEFVARARRPDGSIRSTTSGATARVGRPTSSDNARQPASGPRSSSAAREESKVREVDKAREVSKAPQVSKAPEVSKAREVSKASQVSKAPQVSKAREVSKAPEVRKAPEAVSQAAEEGQTAAAARDKAPAQASPSDSGAGTAKVGRLPVGSPFRPAPTEQQPAPEPAPAKPAKGTVPTVTFKAAK